MIDCYKRISKRLTAAICLAALSLTSCGLIEVRDSYVETEVGEAEAGIMLAQAERRNEVEVRAETFDSAIYAGEAEEPETVIKFTAVGDIRFDSDIVADAANRAGEGSGYSFLKMFSAVYRDVRDADLAIGRDSSIAVECTSGAKNTDVVEGEDDSKTAEMPVEAMAAMAELGFEALDTGSSVKPDRKYAENMKEYGVVDLDPTKSADDGIYTFEKDGVVIAVLSADAEKTDGLLENVEYADFISDVVIVSLKWGSADHDSTAYSIADAGADIIIGSGDTLGGVKWIDTGDGTLTLSVDSLGTFVATGENADELCGGILSVEISKYADKISLDNVCIEPTLVHFEAEHSNYQVFKLSEYKNEIIAANAINEIDPSTMIEKVRGIVGAEFLPSDLK